MSRRRKTERIVKTAVTAGGFTSAERTSTERTEKAGEVVVDQLEALAREGVREMLMTTLADEVDAYLGRAGTNAPPAPTAVATVRSRVPSAATATVHHPAA